MNKNLVISVIGSGGLLEQQRYMYVGDLMLIKTFYTKFLILSSKCLFCRSLRAGRFSLAAPRAAMHGGYKLHSLCVCIIFNKINS